MTKKKKKEGCGFAFVCAVRFWFWRALRLTDRPTNEQTKKQTNKQTHNKTGGGAADAAAAPKRVPAHRGVHPTRGLLSSLPETLSDRSDRQTSSASQGKRLGSVQRAQ